MRLLFERVVSWVYTRVFYGVRCPDVILSCACCRAWIEHDAVTGSNTTY